MAIIEKKINGYGPYRYRVTYENGRHHWEYLGPVDGGSEGSDDEREVTNGGTINLDDGAAPLRTALNAALDSKQSLGTELPRDELVELDDIHGYGNDEIPEEHRELALELLHEYEQELARSEGEATLMDPNAEDEYLTWTRNGIQELDGDVSAGG